MAITATQASPNSTWRLEVEDTESEGTFIPVAGMNSFSPTDNYSTADNSDFNSGLYGSDAVTQIKTQVTATVLRRNDGAAYDAGQEVIRKAARKAELIHLRYYDTALDDGEAYEADAYPQWAPQGGDGTGLQSVNITLLVQGEPTEVANPGAAVELWEAETYYAKGARVELSSGETLEATEEGTSGTTEPTAPGTTGGTVVDGTITWEQTS